MTFHRIAVGLAVAGLIAQMGSARADTFVYTNIEAQAGYKVAQFSCTNLSDCSQTESGITYTHTNTVADGGLFAQVTASGSATLGSLHGSITASASGVGPSEMPTASGGLVAPEWFDTFTITSPDGSLAADTPVEFEIGLELHSTISAVGTPAGVCNSSYGSGEGPYVWAAIDGQVSGPNLTHWLCGGSTDMVATTTETLAVGRQYLIEGQMFLFAGVQTGAMTSDGPFASSAAESANATDTANFFIRPLTAGAGYSASTVYLSAAPVEAVPEPTSAAFLVGGLALVAAVRARKTRPIK